MGFRGEIGSVFDVLIKLSRNIIFRYLLFINHGIREEEASIDQDFRGACKKHNITYSCVKEMYQVLQKEGLSEEEVGRNARYKAFNNSYIENKCTKIAVAHNKNDNAETFYLICFDVVVLQINRIPIVRDSIIRPLCA